jgi:hypothetical protein
LHRGSLKGGYVRPLTDKEIKKLFGAFAYTNRKDGGINIDPDWIKVNIMREQMPIVGVVACHKEVVLHLMKSFTEIEQAKLQGEINVQEFKDNVAGCFVPRHKCWDLTRGLSRHSWGVAIDFNVRANPYNKPPRQHPAIVAIFEKNGFFWGGRFMIKDGMHFEPSDRWRPLEQVTKITIRPSRL